MFKVSGGFYELVNTEIWQGKVIKSELCQLGSYTVPGTENTIKSESAIHYKIETQEGLTIDFCRRSLDSYQTAGIDVVRFMAYPIEPIFREGDEIIVTGKIIEQWGSNLIVECTDIAENPEYKRRGL